MENNRIDFVDFHTHILPSVDHGSDSIETSAKQLKLAKDFGVNKIFATSHFYPHQHTVSSFIEKRNKAYLEIKKLGGDLPEIKLGAEVLLCEGLHRLEGISELCLYGTNILLLELPFTSLTEGMIHAVKHLKERGIDVILAHADRYPRANIENLLRFDLKLQLNADSLTSRRRRKQMADWFSRGLVVGIGSDIHGVDEKAYKRFSKAIDKIQAFAAEIKAKSEEIWEKAHFF